MHSDVLVETHVNKLLKGKSFGQLTAGLTSALL